MLYLRIIKKQVKMTRINLGVPPEILTDQHLLAEIRELPRIPRAVRKKLDDNKPVKGVKHDFKLGTGHVVWFYTRLGLLQDRYLDLVIECEHRGFNVNIDYTLFDGLTDYMGETCSTLQYSKIIKERIALRIRESVQIPKYYSCNVDREEYIKKILEYDK